jgi:hypothetical protein
VATDDLTRALDDAGAAYELRLHAHTESAFAEAQALGLEPEDVARHLSSRRSRATCAPSSRLPAAGGCGLRARVSGAPCGSPQRADVVASRGA